MGELEFEDSMRSWTTKQQTMAKIFDKYCNSMKVRSLKWYFPTGSKWAMRKINKFMAFFAIPLKLWDVVAFLDTTTFRTGKEGMLFTKDGIFIKEALNKLYYIAYEKVEKAEIIEKFDEAGYLVSSELYVHYKDGTKQLVFDYDIRKLFFAEYINDVAEYLRTGYFKAAVEEE